jgi:hypothetical protein
MYLLDLFHEHAGLSGTGALEIQRDARRIAKWTFLPPNAIGLELLRLVALGCSGRPQAGKILADSMAGILAAPPGPLRLEVGVALHCPRDGVPNFKKGIVRGCGLDISLAGELRYRIASKFTRLPRSTSVFNAQGRRAGSHFFLGYGATPQAESRTVFDFSDPWHLNTRSASLFNPKAGLSNPVMVLEWMRHKGIRLSRYPKRKTLESLTGKLAAHLALDLRPWLSLECCLASEWDGLAPWRQRMLLPVLDMVRHVLDANPHAGHPLEEPALILLDRPDTFFPEEYLPSWIDLLDALFPWVQFLVTVPESLREKLSSTVLSAGLVWPKPPEPPRAESPKSSSTHLSAPWRPSTKDVVALVHIDGRLPNFALMKISGFFKSQGRQVELFRRALPDKSCSEIWASSIFYLSSSESHVRRLRTRFGDRLRLGGSGVDVEQRLPPEMEAAEPDYDLYPELGDRAIGFLTRGCTNNCAFCIVPRKEGTVRQVADMEGLLGGRDKLILLDDNILAHHSGPDFLEEMACRNIAVNFNQTLDLRLVDKPIARLLRRVRAMNVTFSRPCLHFSLNNAENLEPIRRKYDLLGFNSRDKVEFICMYGFNTTLEEDVTRFRFLRTLPGAYVFTQRYQPFPGAPAPADLDYFGPDPDPLLDKLVRIIFPQNMKSMEIYYRWISRQYAERYGRLHANLVDTIFRYNNRDRKGRYLATLAGTRPMPL